VTTWFANGGTPPSPSNGKNAFIRWTVYDDLDKRLLDATARMAIRKPKDCVTLETGSWQKTLRAAGVAISAGGRNA